MDTGIYYMRIHLLNIIYNIAFQWYIDMLYSYSLIRYCLKTGYQLAYCKHLLWSILSYSLTSCVSTSLPLSLSLSLSLYIYIYIYIYIHRERERERDTHTHTHTHTHRGVAHGVMVVVWNEHRILSSKPGQGCLHFI